MTTVSSEAANIQYALNDINRKLTAEEKAKIASELQAIQSAIDALQSAACQQ
jgi:hypothetical protein